MKQLYHDYFWIAVIEPESSWPNFLQQYAKQYDFSHSSHEDLRTAEFSQMKSLPKLVSRYLWKNYLEAVVLSGFSNMLFGPSVTRRLFCLVVTADLLNRTAESMNSWFFWYMYHLCLSISNESKFGLLLPKKNACLPIFILWKLVNNYSQHTFLIKFMI